MFVVCNEFEWWGSGIGMWLVVWGICCFCEFVGCMFLIGSCLIIFLSYFFCGV